ncbi:CapA family protein [Gordonia asplenii]|uniref:CapA family protein n=1 Tax=Gordonia asplenii TaxID=2725283 RepID=UPI0028A7EF6F|nr:CapA family protein [Gordonia asplenii]
MRLRQLGPITVAAVAAALLVSASTPEAVVRQAVSATTASKPAPHTPTTRTLTISWVGDNILGTDKNFGGATLPILWQEAHNSPTYFYDHVRSYFDADDLTVANFEVALTTERRERYKGEGVTYHFYGEPAAARTLSASGIDAVTIANNHTFDYGQKGFDDTVRALRAAGVDYFGSGYDGEGSTYDYQVLRDVAGVHVGLLGYQAWTDTPQFRARLRDDFATMRRRGAQVVIPYFHWGIETEHIPYDVQTALAHYCIDQGVDAVIGTHPHVLQSMATYHGKLIAYSLGNFAFGGNNNPTDKRTMILQTRLRVTDGHVDDTEFRVIPTRVSGSESFNDYIPTPYRGAERTQVLGFINEISPSLHGRVSTEFTPVR